MRYPVVVHKDPDSIYGVTVPDLPGCFSAGDTLDEAIQEVVEAIECHVEGLWLEGEAIPAPKTVEFHQLNPDYAGGVWALVTVDVIQLAGKSRRVNITLP
ncbi:MAG: type II toxin-antitoxin system HicB family antitoxin [Chloroflexi bacterium]|nr:type II toxin-antitoxin system HicB family antitoxin [Chloroflexota bacterium]